VAPEESTMPTERTTVTREYLSGCSGSFRCVTSPGRSTSRRRG
jgi:hypothetical protein